MSRAPSFEGPDDDDETPVLLSLDVDEVLAEAARRAPLPAERLDAARRRNRAAAFLALQAAARRGVTSEDPASEALLAKFRRDALRDAGVDERLVRARGAV